MRRLVSHARARRTREACAPIRSGSPTPPASGGGCSTGHPTRPTSEAATSTQAPPPTRSRASSSARLRTPRTGEAGRIRDLPRGRGGPGRPRAGDRAPPARARAPLARAAPGRRAARDSARGRRPRVACAPTPRTRSSTAPGRRRPARRSRCRGASARDTPGCSRGATLRSRSAPFCQLQKATGPRPGEPRLYILKWSRTPSPDHPNR
jgi:hypothetical protein